MGGVPPLSGGAGGPAVLVVGGGPAGMAAAAEAAAAGAAATLLEAGDRPGRKLLLTGRGRCNLTSTLPLGPFVEAYGPNGRFLRNAFSRFFSGDLVRYLDALGVATSTERGGRVYPSSGGAEAVRQALIRHLERTGVTLLTNRRVLALGRGGDGAFTVSGEGFRERADRVVLATGGASFPWTGSRGDGYAISRLLGHTVEPLHPALVPLRCREAFCAALEGLKLRNVNLSFRPGGRRRRESFGEVHFTSFGISGPAVFPLSREVGLLAAKGPVALEIDLKPALAEKVLDGRLQRELALDGKRPLSAVAGTLLPALLVGVFLDAAGLAPHSAASAVTGEMRRRVLRLLKAFPLTATGTLPLERGMVTAGGVRLREVDPVTMESRIVPGLFFCGEILDVDGSTGGFNLQAAFSTGIIAGRSAAGAPREAAG